jgi:hypothetical protein
MIRRQTWSGAAGKLHVPLPGFNASGDLPDGRPVASLDEVLARFGAGTPQRQAVTDRLRRIYALAVATGHLDRLVIFGSSVSDVAGPHDVDVILVLRDDFATENCPPESRVLFDHARADDELGRQGSGSVQPRRASVIG